jgi:hypothetical protein
MKNWKLYNLLLLEWKAELLGHNFENTPLQKGFI